MLYGFETVRQNKELTCPMDYNFVREQKREARIEMYQ